ncbi:hypothetical protein [Ottowia testudinis]|uniref:Uncharacterized protein n=1 Tax=Ottowia testudinis TaxID=2816950 RepID=A0A975CI87_9BURK|nr:hypothetical protein [Ottowia testudinis]QTD44669.1 hypothetical protein J1M35_16495 [Ottowia testudinis]
MTLAKTEQGRAALTQRGLLSRRERQILILCDAKRTLDDLIRMMDVDIVQDVSRLEEQGLLMMISPTLRQVAQFSDTGTIEFMPTQPAGVTMTAALA